jgi:signal transduction histidine kinase
VTTNIPFKPLNPLGPNNEIKSIIFDQIAHSWEIAYALVNQDGLILAYNPRMQSWIEAPGDLTGQNLVEFLPELAGWDESVFTTFAELFILPKICRSRPKQAEVYFDLRVEPLLKPEQTWLVTLIDKTEEAYLQQRLVQERNELRLNYSQRKRAEEQRDDLINQLENFAGMVAHNLKSPISNIIGYALLVNQHFDQLTPAEVRHALETITHNAYKMSAMIENLLLLAQVRPTEVKHQPLEMQPIVDEAWRRLNYLAQELEAEISLPATWPVALGYGPWVEEIWANYLSNGLKYGGRPPRLELGAKSQLDGTVQFWIKDNGAGISPEDSARLFTSFTRLGQTEEEGHGLGLSIVKEIVAKLGGEVGVKSQPGQGSLFSFTLPAA